MDGMDTLLQSFLDSGMIVLDPKDQQFSWELRANHSCYPCGGAEKVTGDPNFHGAVAARAVGMRGASSDSYICGEEEMVGGQRYTPDLLQKVKE